MPPTAVAPSPPPGYPPYQYPPHPQFLPLAPNGLPLADFGQRLLAYLLDSLIVGLVGTVLVIPLYLWWILAILTRMEAAAQPPAPGVADPALAWVGELLLLTVGLFAAVLVVTMLLTYLYHVEMMFRSGRTLGKRVMKLQVVPVAAGANLTRRHAVRRWVVQWGGGTFIPFFSYLDGLWQLWDKPLRQCLHDKLAQTVVIRLPG